jgi:hypothetical protein
MAATRIEVDRLLAGGKIQEAEQYMEARRQIFVAHGYQIRKLNQAYFAFYGGREYEDLEALYRTVVGKDPAAVLGN